MRRFAKIGMAALPLLTGLMMADLMMAGAAHAATLADLAGTWSGSLTAPSGAQAPIVVHVMADGTGSVDSPAQDVFGVPATDVALEHNLFSFSIQPADAEFHGMLDGEVRVIEGQWEQEGKSLPLRLIRRNGAPAP